MAVNIRSAEEIGKIKKACRIVAEVFEKIKVEVRAGKTTEDLDKLAEELIRARGAYPVFLGYRGFKNATCISINEEIVHGIPKKRVLCGGDIVSIDIGAKIDGYIGDAAKTFPVGSVSRAAAKLIKTCKLALEKAIKQVKPGNHLGDVSSAIQKLAEREGYSVVRELYGHGVGTELHEDPLIPNFGNPKEGTPLKPGMVLAIEPMLNMGTWKIRTLDDGWTIVTADGKLSSHFEHTVLVTEKGCEVLTR
ncbi:MAG: type I methionyl aminopeptidase [Candidatus Margulisbacteria bacterium]|nr:type I methionyl aminopeptidase [Candidatus Margulisiibacteriota bacterium]